MGLPTSITLPDVFVTPEDDPSRSMTAGRGGRDPGYQAENAPDPYAHLSFVPVDHDPFAPQLVPVDHDPFAEAAASTAIMPALRSLGDYLSGRNDSVVRRVA